MSEERKLSTSDIAAADRHESRETTDRVPASERPRAVEHEEAPAPLFVTEDAAGYRTRWSAIQTGFVDEPRKAVEEADTLVAEVMKRLAEVFAEERGQLESQWEKADQISTEDLRLAMRRYRSFFERLLSI
jgi:hypothetical protein